MLAKLGIVFAAPFVLLGAFVITTDTLVVDVREGGEDGTHILLPVPLALARAAVALAPREELEITCAELWRYRDAVSRVVHELDRAPDGELVRVEEPGTSVCIRKEGRFLLVHVVEDNTQVDLRFPLRAAARFLDRLEGETFHVKDLLAATSHTMTGRVVHVVDGDEEVTISVW